MPDALPAAFELRIPTLLAFARPVRKMVQGLMAAQGWSEDDCDEVGLLVTEVLQNGIEHGSKSDGSEWVNLTCRLDAEAIWFDVVDPGTGSDPQVALDKDPTEPPSLEAPRGRGMFLIHRLTSQFDRALHENGGLRVVVRKESESS